MRRAAARVLARGLAFDPDRRYRSMTAIAGELERALPRRRRFAVGAGLAAALVV